jgi:hypothetical protein
VLARFFIDRPILAWVISILIILAGLVAGVTLPIAQYPEDHAARRAGYRLLSRRQLQSRCRNDWGTDRTAGQWCRRHALHVFPVD